LKKLIILLVSIAFCALIIGVWASQRHDAFDTAPVEIPPSKTPIVIELFTSQGCVSCPPADRLLATLVTKDNVYALSCHVTYWDYNGWNDTLGLPVCNQRQKGLGQTLGNGSRIYTPQMIINGHVELIGSSVDKVVNAISQLQTSHSPIRYMDISLNGAQITLDMPDLGATKLYNVTLFFIKKHVETPIGRGSNRDKTIEYVQNVRAVEDAGTWGGAYETRTVNIPPQISRSINFDEIIAVARDGLYGQIRAVGRYTL